LGNLSTPKSVQKLQMALHAEAKAEAGYRFYALYDKISREDILAHAYAQCRSNKGAPGVDGQEFADVETYGVLRWLGELALALGRRLTGRTPSEECTYRRPTANSGRWGKRTVVGRLCKGSDTADLSLKLRYLASRS
jgi:RNA-directed DNA polymerase